MFKDILVGVISDFADIFQGINWGWKNILGGCILISPLVIVVGALAWETNVFYALVHLALAIAAFAGVLIWMAASSLLFSD